MRPKDGGRTYNQLFGTKEVTQKKYTFIHAYTGPKSNTCRQQLEDI